MEFETYGVFVRGFMEDRQGNYNGVGVSNRSRSLDLNYLMAMKKKVFMLNR